MNIDHAPAAAAAALYDSNAIIKGLNEDGDGDLAFLGGVAAMSGELSFSTSLPL